MRRMSYFFWRTCCCLLGLVSVELRGETPLVAPEPFPVETVFLFSTTNMAELSAAWLRTPPGKTLASPAFSEFRRQQSDAEITSALSLRPMFGVDWSDLAQVRGPVELAACPVSDKRLEMVLRLEVEPGDQSVSACRESAERYFRRHGYHAKSIRIAGQNWEEFQRERRGQIERRWMAATARGFIVTTGVGILPQIFASPISKREADEQDTGTPRCQLAVRPLAWARYQAGQNTQAIESAERLGAAELDEFRGEVQFPPAARTMIRIEGSVPTTTSLQKASRLLEFVSGSPNWQLPPTTAEMDSIGSWRWDFRVAIPALGNLLDEWMEPGPDGVGLFEDILDGLRDDPEGPQVDLRRELFARLGPRVIGIGGPMPDDRSQRQSLFLMECHDESAIRAVLDKMYRDDEEVRFEELIGYSIYWIDGAGSLFIDAETDDVPTVRAAAVGRNTFLAASNISFLRSLLQSAKSQRTSIWNRLSAELKLHQADQSGGQAFILSEKRFGGAYQRLILDQSAQGFEETLLAWCLLGNSANSSNELATVALPPSEQTQGLFMPCWLQYRKELQSIWIQVGLVDEVTP